MSAQLLSLQVGLPQTVDWRSANLTTGIFKDAVSGRVQLDWLNLRGDAQADLSVHGGPDKAVYVYPSEHYAYWRRELPSVAFPWGAFGENFTTEGIQEEAIFIGDRFKIGTAEVMVVQPRLPCYKLGVKFGRADMPKLFLKSARLGFYLRVTRPGEVGPGDEIVPCHRDEHQVKLSDIVRLYLRQATDRELIHRALEVKALPEGWRAMLLMLL